MKETRDILTLFEALSNYEVFTPPRIARDILDLLPESVWTNPNLKFLDPCTKSGVFLRECFFRLESGLRGKSIHKAEDGIEYDLNDFKQRTTHILKNMLYGISISELTGYTARRTLYGVMEANTDKQIEAIESFERSKNNDQWTEQEKWNFIGRNKFNEFFDHNMFMTPEYEGHEHEGNVFFPRDEVQKLLLENGNYEIEDTYFPFIDDRTKHKKIKQIKGGKLKFDVIVGNPPYQISDGGAGASAKPIYHQFVEQSLKLNPTYISFIIPSRWFTGGKGLNDFRQNMLKDRCISHLVDFPNAKDCFPGNSIGGGVCYFLRDKNHNGDCEITNVSGGNKTTVVRALNQFDVFIRHNQALPIIEKIKSKNEASLSSLVSSRNPFGYPTKVRGDTNPTRNSLKLFSSSGESYVEKSSLEKNHTTANSWKVMISRITSEHAGEPDSTGKFKVLSKINVLKPDEVCTDSYLIIGRFDDESSALNLANYLKTKLARFLLQQAVTSINLSSERFEFIPLLDFSQSWDDSTLYQKYSLTSEEITFIDSLIKDMS
jgi:site-specific DNA-methyltransferase (adenine-specific)